ncbi:Tc toxin subunit A [Planctomycetota bacterium]
MELIKKIKEAEKQAQQIIDKAKSEAAEQIEQFRQRQVQVLEEAEVTRKEQTKAAVAEAETKTKVELQDIQKQADKDRRQLHDKAKAKMDKTIDKVMDYLKG